MSQETRERTESKVIRDEGTRCDIPECGFWSPHKGEFLELKRLEEQALGPAKSVRHVCLYCIERWAWPMVWPKPNPPERA